ncbi:hypothetical protein BC826DRAFT_188008 [Russula brevipes]|nr:hypothetical protein BC826DRAFT_188008 [Russula brevipes]
MPGRVFGATLILVLISSALSSPVPFINCHVCSPYPLPFLLFHLTSLSSASPRKSPFHFPISAHSHFRTPPPLPPGSIPVNQSISQTYSLP